MLPPLTLSIDEYNENLRASLIDRLFTIDPFFYREERVFTRTVRNHLGIVPFLRGHVSIPPHEKVTTSEHYYSYSKSGGNIAWHSGEKLKGDFRLSTQFRQILNYAYSNKGAGYNKEEFVKFIEAFLNERNEKFDVQQNSIDRTIFEFGIYLKQVYNINTDDFRNKQLSLTRCIVHTLRDTHHTQNDKRTPKNYSFWCTV